MKTPVTIERRKFIHNAFIAGMSGGIILMRPLTREPEEEEVTPTEDLMREHGLLSRIILIYDNCRMHLVNNEDFDMTVLGDSARIVRSFVEDYHEKLEENYLFPRFERANKLVDLVSILREQHNAGRELTDPILKISNGISSAEKPKYINLLQNFTRMYRPHKSREDTVLFPAIHQIIPKKEYLEMGDKFEDKEHELFGEKGFESMVGKVADLERKLNIYDLSQFTPV